MNLTEFKEVTSSITFKIEKLNVKKYLPILHKKIIIDNICEDCVSYDENNNLAFVNPVQQKISTSIAVLLNYCDLEIEESESGEVIDLLDSLFKDGIYIKIEEAIGGDIGDLCWMLELELENVKIKNNSIEAVLANGINDIKIILTDNLQKFIDVIDKNTNSKTLQKLSKGLAKELNGFNWDSIPMLKDIFKTVNKGKVNKNVN